MHRLRCTDTLVCPRSAREGAKAVLILGPDELQRGVVVVRDMTSGKQQEIPIGDVG